jgi:hypothetical protein
MRSGSIFDEIDPLSILSVSKWTWASAPTQTQHLLTLSFLLAARWRVDAHTRLVANGARSRLSCIIFNNECVAVCCVDLKLWSYSPGKDRALTSSP